MNGLVLQMPSNYVDIERGEMEYVDGGNWSGYTFAHNLYGYITSHGLSRALAYSGVTLGAILGWARYSYTAAAVTVGSSVARIAAIVGGVIAGVAAAAGTTYLVYWMGSARRYY